MKMKMFESKLDRTNTGCSEFTGNLVSYTSVFHVALNVAENLINRPQPAMSKAWPPGLIMALGSVVCGPPPFPFYHSFILLIHDPSLGLTVTFVDINDKILTF